MLVLLALTLIFLTLVVFGVKIMSVLDDLEAKVTEVSTVEDSVITLLGEAVKMLKEARDNPDPSRINALIRALDQRKEKLAAAVTANTLPSPETEETDVETPTDSTSDPAQGPNG